MPAYWLYQVNMNIFDPENSPEAFDTHTRNFRCQPVDVFNLLHDRLQYTEDGGTFGCCAKKPAN